MSGALLARSGDQNLSGWSERHLGRLQKATEDLPAGSLAEPESLNFTDNLVADQEALIGDATISMKEMLPGQKRAQSGIAVRAWGLGQVLSLSILFTFYALAQDSPLWRPAFFMSCLSLFHFLEFWTHAKFNLPNATISAFLLFDNGWPYLLAHTAAMIETVVTSIYYPQWQAKFTPWYIQYQGFALILVGQIVRSMAIAKAGTNFNHQVQHKKTDSHELVTDGIYAIFRHPSYFGFFWWAVGTQIALGNLFCLIAYAAVLWRFFNHRIHVEEKHLTKFFGKHYVFYRRFTKIGIPLIESKDYPELVAAYAEEHPVVGPAAGVEDKKTE